MVYEIGDKVKLRKNLTIKLEVTKAGTKKDGTQEQVECLDEQGTIKTYWVDQLQK